jgi:hypothetical protein
VAEIVTAIYDALSMGGDAAPSGSERRLVLEAGDDDKEGRANFTATVPPDFNLEDLAELPRRVRDEGATQDDVEQMLEKLRWRYRHRVDVWIALARMADDSSWKLLAEDALMCRLEGTSSLHRSVSSLSVEWLQEPPWGPCEWLNQHKTKAKQWINTFDPPVAVKLSHRQAAGGGGAGSGSELASVARLVLFSPRGEDISDYDGGNLQVGLEPTVDIKASTVTYPVLGINMPSEKFPSSRGMRPGLKARRGAKGWYFFAVHVPGHGVSLLWDSMKHEPADIVVKHFRNKWNKPGEARGPFASHDGCIGSHVAWVEGRWQLKCVQPGGVLGGGQ